LTTNGIAFETVNYLEKRLSVDELRRLIRRTGLSPQELLRTTEDAYRELVVGRELGDEKLIEIMAEHPELIQRPIVVKGDNAVLARPVENLAELGILKTGRK
jgi:arsenate reductase (glutaredoxin)